jgi:hypothetical protein
MTTLDKQKAFSLMVAQLIEWAYQQGYQLVLGEAKRTHEMQELYVKQGKSKTMNSEHCVSLAIDLSLFVNGEYKTDADSYLPLGEKWEGLGGGWGGRFGDNPETETVEGWDSNHFQYSRDGIKYYETKK